MTPGDRTRNILIGIVLLIVVILIAVFFIRQRQANILEVNSPLPTPVSNFQENLQTNFGITVPSTATKRDLRDVTGGSQMGLVTLDKNQYTVIANLEDPQAGYFYQAWLVNGLDYVSLGKLSVSKGGWIVNYSSPKDLSDHRTVWVTLERVFDSTPEKHILEGSL